LSCGFVFTTVLLARSTWVRNSGARCSSRCAIRPVFSQFKIDPVFHTLVWPNGADIAPEFLHDNIRVTA